MVVTFDAEAFAQTLQRMAGGRRLHIISRGNRWALIRERTDRALRVLDTKAAAIYHAMPYLATGYDIVVHHRDGTVEERLPATPPPVSKTKTGASPKGPATPPKARPAQ